MWVIALKDKCEGLDILVIPWLRTPSYSFDEINKIKHAKYNKRNLLLLRTNTWFRLKSKNWREGSQALEREVEAILL